MKIKKSQLISLIRESIEEIALSTVGSAIKKSKQQRRDITGDNIAKMALLRINKDYAFNTKVDDLTANFRLVYDSQVNKFGIELIIISDRKIRIVLDPETKYGNFYNTEAVINTPFGYVIDNLRAGERQKLKMLRQSGVELNNSNENNNHNS